MTKENPKDFLDELDEPQYDLVERDAKHEPSIWEDLWQGMRLLFSLPLWFLGGPMRGRRQRRCMHHDRMLETSWIESMLIESGMGKMFWCTHCGQTWFV